VFLNLVNNALYAVDEKGKITIETGYDGGSGRLQVSFIDSGGGIREQDRRRIFDPFYTTKPPGQGTGLGLSVSYGIVTEHGGDITVFSIPEGGTKFTVSLPVSHDTPKK
jgi:signal transduction histidine kinase